MPERGQAPSAAEDIREKSPRGLDETQRAMLNIMEDFDEEKTKLQLLQQATMNLLEDMNEERARLDETQRALLNILDDIEMEVEARRQAEEALRGLNEELERRVVRRTAELEASNKELEAFSYSVSHDLRAPLRGIDGFSRILLEDHADRLDQEGRRVLNVIRGETQHMARLIDDLLAFSRIGRKEISRGFIDMSVLAESAIKELKPEARGRRVEFTVGALPAAPGDRTMIRQVMANLLSNALKFTRPRAEARIEVGGGIEGTESFYYVRDNGVGFDMKYAGKLFGVFQRLHSASEFEGTGVGLAIVQRIVLKHGGRVWAEGKVNDGATFYFTLPSK